MTEPFSKEALQEYGIFAGSVVLLVLILSLTVIFTEGMRRERLRAEAIEVLEEAESGVWRVGDFIEFDSPASLSAACFRASGGNGSGYVCIVRMQTIYGPVSAVFILNERYEARFVALAGVHGRTADAIGSGAAKSQIRYWSERISRLMRTSRD